MYLDSHVHVWELSRGDYTWISPDNPILFQDRLPSQLEPLLSKHNVAGIVLVEAASTVEETEYMLELAERYSWIQGVVGGLDIAGPSFEEDYKRLRANSKFVGIRINGSRLEQQDIQAQQLLHHRLQLLQQDQLAVDLLVRAHQLPEVIACLTAFPHLKAVINHLGVPLVKEQIMKPWIDDMHIVQRFPNVMVKISGMITQAGGFKPDLLEKYVHFLADSFSSQRLMFGSDWPVALMGGTYDEVIELFETLLPVQWSETERERVRYSNALRFYGISCEEDVATDE